jgi:hypothetical protein
MNFDLQWFRNRYECVRCAVKWEDEWSCMCDDRCPDCDLEMMPYESENLTHPLSEEDLQYAERRLPRPVWCADAVKVILGHLESR